MAQDMAQGGGRSDKASESFGAEPTDDATQMKKRARRRLIGAAALALLAAIVLPMVMDHQPAPPLRDIQVRIPSPDEGVTQRVAARPLVPAPKESTPAPAVEPVKPVPRDEPPKPIAKVESPGDAKVVAKPDTKSMSNSKVAEKAASDEAPDKTTSEAWEVQLGAYQDAGRVKNLLGKLKDLGVPTYTEKVDTPNGARTRVRAGPYPSQEAAEKARLRVKIIGVDGPVAKKS